MRWTRGNIGRRQWLLVVEEGMEDRDVETVMDDDGWGMHPHGGVGLISSK